jgi:cyclase
MKKKKRLIPVLLLKNGMLVQSRGFNRHQILGNPITAVKRLSEWASDELIYLDISRDNNYDLNRDDQGYENVKSFLGIIEYISKETFMPITIGGKIKKLIDIEERLMLCADKVSINSKAIENKNFISTAAKEFGSQCIVVSVDAKRMGKEFYVFSNFGKVNSKIKVRDWLRQVQEEGAGEILLNSIDNDGLGLGYDVDLLEEISSDINIPIIICGGVGDYIDFEEGLKNPKIDAVAAANIFHYKDQSVYLAKKYLYDEGYNVRKPDLLEI